MRHLLLLLLLEHKLKRLFSIEKDAQTVEPIQTPLHSLNLDTNVINMNVKGSSKVANLISYAQNKFEVNNHLKI